jgi:hypothetical protein
MSGSSGLLTEAIETWFREEIEANKIFECAHPRRTVREGRENLPPIARRRSASPARGRCLARRRPGACKIHC